MKIREYDEVDEQQVIDLNLGCFGWFLPPKRVKKLRKLDPRIPDYFALYAVEGDEILSQVGALTVDTQTTSGLEKLGYFWGVCTHPKAARQGLAGKLMEEAHLRMRAEGLRYSFLGTSSGFVAYNLYRKLGYMDFIRLGWTIKPFRPNRTTNTEVTITSQFKKELMEDIFRQYSKGLLGFVHRPDNFSGVKKAWGWPPVNMNYVFEKNGKSIGYILANKEGKNIKVWELSCLKSRDIKGCLESIEEKYKSNYISFEMFPGSFQAKALERIGVKSKVNSWVSLMIKNLIGKRSVRKLYDMYGIGKDKFLISSMDEY
jgi:ribosomal protein S18 acetylase RimI-like enzyme